VQILYSGTSMIPRDSQAEMDRLNYTGMHVSIRRHLLGLTMNVPFLKGRFMRTVLLVTLVIFVIFLIIPRRYMYHDATIVAQDTESLVRDGNPSLSQPISSGCHGRTIAMGIAVTFRIKKHLLPWLFSENVQLSNTPFFYEMLPSFLETTSTTFCYSFHVAYDFNDPFLSTQTGQNSFRQYFFKALHQKQTSTPGYIAWLTLVMAEHSGRPAWAQNDAMMQAYHHSNATYFYMVNDDTQFITSYWSENMTLALHNMQPYNVGTVGPNHNGGDLTIMTHNFVHRTHIDIFGFFYPRVFQGWYADAWMTSIYRPEYSRKMPLVKVRHSLSEGTRYDVKGKNQEEFDYHIMIAQEKIHQWIKLHARVRTVL